jgi:asparagine synthase (glutamine-hydrolysing)
MCGIVAIHSPDAPIPPDLMSRGIGALTHRGPDGQSAWYSPNGHAALGHTSLILVDPEAAQPIASEDGGLQIVANGEFYGDDRIRRELQGRGHVLRTRSDSEIALHLYEDRGRACIHELRGEFAFVIWDERRKMMLAARDRFGIKPLFYAQIGRTTYMASEVRALHAMGVPAAWDHEAVYQTLHSCFDARRTLFQGIRQVPPSHVLIATDDGVRVERYWDVTYPRRDATIDLAQDACVERVRGLLEEAVRLRMRGAFPVGCLLSGGLDSSAVLGIMARHSDRPVTTFTIGFTDASYDESARAAATAEHVGAHAHVLRLTDRDLADHFVAAVRSGETVQLNAHGIARFLLSRRIHQLGYRAVLGGEGADELFAGYAFLDRATPKGGWSSRLPSWLSGALRLARPVGSDHARLAQTSPWLSRVTRLLAVPAIAVCDLTERFALVRSVLAPELVVSMQHFDPCERLYRSLELRADSRRWEPAKQVLYLWLRTLFASYHMAADRLDMAHAVEVRLPFLDHVLFEFASQIPMSRLVNNTQNKLVLREAVRSFVPKAVCDGIKKPFLAPPAATRVGSPLHDLLQDTLRGPLPSFMNRAGVLRLLDDLPITAPAALSATEALLMALASLCVLGTSYGVAVKSIVK